MSIQVLPYVPSFGEQLAPVLAQALGDVGKGLQQRFVNRQDEKIIGKMFDPNLTDLQRIELSLKLSPERRDSFYKAVGASTKAEQFGYQKSREKRLAHSDILNAYDKRITQINNDLKETASREERKRLRELKDNLTREQAVNRTRLRGGKQPEFKYLEMQDAQVPAQAPQPIQTQTAAPQPQSSMTQPMAQRIKWDPRNPDHIARRNAVLNQVGNNRQSAQQILSEEFE